MESNSQFWLLSKNFDIEENYVDFRAQLFPFLTFHILQNGNTKFESKYSFQQVEISWIFSVKPFVILKNKLDSFPSRWIRC